METSRAAPVVAIAVGAAAVWLVPGLDPVLGALVALLGAGTAWAVWTGYGGPILVLCLGETFAVGLGTAAPVLGVLAQPLIAALVVGTENRTAFALAAVAATAAAAGVLLFRHTLVPLLLVAALAAVFLLALAILEAWLRRRFSGGLE